MALEKLIQRIESDAENEANQIIEDARRRAEEIIEEAKKRAEKEARDIEARGEKEAAPRELEIQAKEEVIRECIDRAKEDLKKLKGKKYEDAIKKCIEDGKKSLGDCVVVPSREQDRKIAEKMGVKAEGKVDR